MYGKQTEISFPNVIMIIYTDFERFTTSSRSKVYRGMLCRQILAPMYKILGLSEVAVSFNDRWKAGLVYWFSII